MDNEKKHTYMRPQFKVTLIKMEQDIVASSITTGETGNEPLVEDRVENPSTDSPSWVIDNF